MYKNIVLYIKDILAPKKCYSCKKEGHFFCQKCLQERKQYSPFCYQCKQDSQNFKIHQSCKKYKTVDNIIVMTRYKDPYIRKAIVDGKYYGKKEVYDDLWIALSYFFQKKASWELYTPKNTIITCIPMHFLRRWKRGYNHGDLLGKIVSKELQIPYLSNALVRKRYTKQQSKLHKKKRQDNIKDAFWGNIKILDSFKNKTVIIVDDVVSTGSTLLEASKILKQHGVKRVIGLVIASD